MEERFVSIGQNTVRPCLLDAKGRRLFLRGVNVNALIEYASDYQEAVPLAEADFMEMRALGFNLIRLPISCRCSGVGLISVRYAVNIGILRNLSFVLP